MSLDKPVLFFDDNLKTNEELTQLVDYLCTLNLLPDKFSRHLSTNEDLFERDLELTCYVLLGKLCALLPTLVVR